MKREAVLHTKMKRLCRRLDIPTYQAVGILESVWHLTARETPRGDIGKLTDEDIALAIDYRGDEVKMIEALVSAGWLDRDAVERLVVHDWADHADDAVHMKLARACAFFAGGHAPKYARLSGKERDCAEKFYSSTHAVRTESPAVHTDSAQNDGVSALPEPRPASAPPEPFINTCASGDARVSDSPSSVENPPIETTEPDSLFVVQPLRKKPDLKTLQLQWFEEWWSVFWRKVSKKPALSAFQEHVQTAERFRQVMTAVRVQSPEMLLRDESKRPHGATWLNQERWTDEAPVIATNGHPAKPPFKPGDPVDWRAILGREPNFIKDDPEEKPVFSASDSIVAWIEERLQRHPNKRDAMLAKSRICEVREATSSAWRAEFERVHDLWCATEKWLWKQGSNCPTLACWIVDQGWRYEPVAPIDVARRAPSALDSLLEEVG